MNSREQRIWVGVTWNRWPTVTTRSTSPVRLVDVPGDLAPTICCWRSSTTARGRVRAFADLKGRPELGAI